MLKKLSLVAVSLFALGAFNLVGLSSNASAADTCPNTDESSGWTKYDNWPDSQKTQSHTAPAGYVVVEVCVKGGNNIEFFTTNGTKSCWVVAGIGTQTASASENWVGDDKGPECKDISHASFRVAKAPDEPGRGGVTPTEPKEPTAPAAQQKEEAVSLPVTSGSGEAAALIAFSTLTVATIAGVLIRRHFSALSL